MVRKREALSRTMRAATHLSRRPRRGLLKMRSEQDDFASTRRPCGRRYPRVSVAHRDAVSYRWQLGRRLSLLGRVPINPTYRRCPLYTQKRTSEARLVMSAMGQQQTPAPCSITSSARRSSDVGTSTPIACQAAGHEGRTANEVRANPP